MSDHHSADLYAAAAQKTQSVIAGVKADQFNDSTPCSDWNVQALVDHLVSGIGFFATTLTGGSSDAPTDDKPAAAYAAEVAKTVEIGKAMGMQKKVNSPFGEFTAGEFIVRDFDGHGRPWLGPGQGHGPGNELERGARQARLRRLRAQHGRATPVRRLRPRRGRPWQG